MSAKQGFCAPIKLKFGILFHFHDANSPLKFQNDIVIFDDHVKTLCCPNFIKTDGIDLKLDSGRKFMPNFREFRGAEPLFLKLGHFST